VSSNTLPGQPRRIVVVGAGPAGIYVADELMKRDPTVRVDILERQPAPFGLIRYGVAPDHPRIQGIMTALRGVLSKPSVRFLGNVTYGVDVVLADLQQRYDAVVFTTGADADRDLAIPGIDLPGSYGAADFVSWYDARPDLPTDWDLDAEQVAVIGAGNVALDVARMLAKTGPEFAGTDAADHVYDALVGSRVREVHVFARRGPAQAKFTPLELRELDHSPNVEVVVDPEDIDYDAGSMTAIAADNQLRLVVRELERYALRDPGDRPRRLHLHFFAAPIAVLGTDRVEALRTERTELDGTGRVRGTGAMRDWPVQAVYRAVGYRSVPVAGLPFDEAAAVVPHRAGRVLDAAGDPIPGVYVNGWIKRGPVGLIGHTKGDAIETVTSLLADLDDRGPAAGRGADDLVDVLRARDVDYVDWDGWLRLDAHEEARGIASGRGRVKVADRQTMLRVAGGLGLEDALTEKAS
jgi:ferredoxin/flavodoxin---NADP+ reductase